jgi:methionyl-tRNA synthetase
LKWGQLQLGTKLGEVQPVFPRADKSAVERMLTMEEQGRPATTAVAETTTHSSTPPVATQAGGTAAVSPVAGTGDGRLSTGGTQAATPKPPAAVPDGKISIDDFVKVELRVGVVKIAEKVKNADKLLRLEVDIGSEVRQIVAGIAEAYAPETLVGRKVVIVANLAPRKLRGLESNGMIVAASPEGGQPVLAGFLEDVPVGARLK